MDAEGWYVDPFGVHEARWISQGSPTALVRDEGVESSDPPPDVPFTGELEPCPEPQTPDGDDLRRADDADSRQFDPDAEEDSAWDAFGASAGAD
ncbi:MAG: hypothetical protein ABSF84_08140 [Acidimicrobiales bacterium]|jgi:hypothetical protein